MKKAVIMLILVVLSVGCTSPIGAKCVLLLDYNEGEGQGTFFRMNSHNCELLERDYEEIGIDGRYWGETLVYELTPPIYCVGTERDNEKQKEIEKLAYELKELKYQLSVKEGNCAVRILPNGSIWDVSEGCNKYWEFIEATNTLKSKDTNGVEWDTESLRVQ